MPPAWSPALRAASAPRWRGLWMRAARPCSLVARSAIAERYRDAHALAADLSDPYSIDELLDGFARFVAERSCRCLLVFNNAGTVAPIAPASRCRADQVDSAIRLNLTAPMLVTGGFIRRFADADLPKLVVNVSSGAASSPYHGWSTYCAGKAGLDHFTRCAGSSSAPRPIRRR
ncbi:MAG: SDR family NAD(P)-dependent oxidoreductase [Gammaproteobacteria bacterium]|nr:SDR family NAD(P)-dependent oxidoreductase [Gammaproteobacteria bacterium]